jgi:hypothetical protein
MQKPRTWRGFCLVTWNVEGYYIQPSKWTLAPNKVDEAISQTGRRRWYQKRSAGSDVAALPTLVLVLNIKFNPLISVVAILGARDAFITIVFFHSFLDVVCHLATGFKFPI